MKQNKYLFLAIKPEFANKILAKEKTIELRKVRPNIKEGDYIIIYASSPVKGVVGFGRVKKIIETSPYEMWRIYSTQLGIDKIRYDNYFLDRKKAIGIEIESIRTIQPMITLEAVKEIDISFTPPQGYRYVSNNQILQLLQTIVSKLYV